MLSILNSQEDRIKVQARFDHKPHAVDPQQQQDPKHPSPPKSPGPHGQGTITVTVSDTSGSSGPYEDNITWTL